ncbi:MAG: beta-galactosidase [Acidobacteriaceae bacterium]
MLVLSASVSVTLLLGCGSQFRSSGSSQSATTSSPSLDCTPNGGAEGVGINQSDVVLQSLETPNIIAALQQSGAQWVRIKLPWAETEPRRGVFDWSASDGALNSLQAANINVLVILDGPVPCWAVPGVTGCAFPYNSSVPAEQWAGFVTAAVTRYSNKVHYWEIWNEPNLTTYLDITDPRQRLITYRDNILAPAAQSIRQVDPTANLVGPAFGMTDLGGDALPNPELQAALSLVLSGSSASNLDIISLHSYYPETAYQKAAAAHLAMKSAGIPNRPVWITEDGADLTSFPPSTDPEGERAAFLASEINTTLVSGGADKLFWFGLLDAETSAGTHLNNYGLIDNLNYTTYPWTPRESYTVLQTIIKNGCGI